MHDSQPTEALLRAEPELDASATTNLWTGELLLQLRNGRDWEAGQARVTLTHDDMRVSIFDRERARLGRDWFRIWLQMDEPPPYPTGELVWTRHQAATCLRYGMGYFTVTTASLEALRSVL